MLPALMRLSHLRAALCRCGPARHSILLAQSAGCDCTALDISQPMLDYAAHKAAAAGVADKLHFAQVLRGCAACGCAA